MTENIQPDDDVHPDELIVDTRHRDAVVAVLSDFDVWPAPDEEVSDDLGLTLLKNLRLDAYAGGARTRYAHEIAALEGGGRAFTPLDVLLYELRVKFAAERGSVPVLGKNRDAIIGYPQHKGVKNPVLTTREVVIPDTQDGHGVRIGAVDTPIAPHALLPVEFVRRDMEFKEHTGVHVWAGHGNFVAGLIRQAAPAAHLDMRAGLAPDTGTSSAWEVAKKIASFQHSGIHILNLSLGCVTADNEPPLVLRRALEKLDPQVLVVAAAGNRANADFPPAQVWPAAATGVIAVGAVDQGGALAEFCLDKAWTRCFAPGVAVTSTYLTDTVTLDDGEEIEFTGTAEWSGTSFATAAVTGKIAARMTADDVSARDALCLVLHDATSQVTLRPKDPDA